MKKIIIGMLFVFATNAFTQIYANCSSGAFALQSSLEAQGYDMELANAIANDWYEACLGMNF